MRAPLRSLIAAIRASRKSLIGASFIVVQPLVLNAISLPVTAYIIATLGSLDYGQWSIALALVTTCAVLTNLGLRSFFVRAVSWHPETAPQAFAEQLGSRMLLAVGAGAVSVSTAYLLGYPALVWQCTAILALGAIFTAAAAVVSDLLTATERLPALATINFVAGLILTAASIVAMWMGSGPLGLATAYVIGPVLSGVLSLLLVQRRMFPVRIVCSLSRCWSLLKQARILGLQLFVVEFGNQAENLMVPKLVGISAFGYFAAGTLLPRRLDILSDGLNTAFYPVLARSYRDSRRTAVATTLRLGLFMVAACVPPAVVLFLLAHPIARLLFPENPDVCATVIRITAWCIPLLGVGHGMGYALNAAGRERDEARLAIIGTVISLVLSVVLISKFGLIGACFGLVGKAAVGVVLRLRCFVATLRLTDMPVAPAPAAVEPSV